MTAVAPRPRVMVSAAPHATADPVDTARSGDYVGRHRRDDRRAHHAHAGAAALAIMLAWIPAASARRGRHRG